MWKAKPLSVIDQHPGTLNAISEHGETLRQNGDFDAAENRLRYALRRQEQVLPSKHPDIERTRERLTRAVKEGGNYPELIRQPVSQQVKLGNAVKFSVECSGHVSRNARYQWYFADIAIGNANRPTLTIPKVEANDLGRYPAEID